MFALERWEREDYRDLQRYLESLGDEKYRAFNSRIVADEARGMIGVRVPMLRKIAGEIARGDYRSFLAVTDGERVEEVMLEGLVIAFSKSDYRERHERYRTFCDKITDWAICDVVCSAEKDGSHIEETIAFTKSDKPFAVRFGLVRLLASYVNEEHVDRVLEVASSVTDPHYYVAMANAWLISVCYVKFRDKTEPVLAALPEDTRKKAKQKIRDSYRVPREAKQNL